MEHKSLLNASQLDRLFGQHHAVKDVSFELSRGEILGFLGPNGAGKTTTMRMLAGTLAPSSGSILINGIDLLESPSRAKAHIGYLPEQPPLYREHTVSEFLNYCARLHRINNNAIGPALARAMERCGLVDVSKRLIGNLSKGYQQRIGIAQAILHNPAIVILDEPTVGLDPIQIRDIRQLIRDLGQDHGVILSTHILPEVQATCTRVQIINHGRLVFADSMSGLEERLTENTLKLETVRPFDIHLLETLPGIENVEVISDRQALLNWQTEKPAEAVATLVAAQNWGLMELAPQRRNLEQVFIDLTCSDISGEAKPARTEQANI
ncbi:MAG: ATP-binding cassette domain-containing protein [Gammaproteobacteria bacterium]